MCVTAVSSFSPKCLKTGGQDQERKHKKRRGEFYSIQTSLIVAALKKMLPIGLNMCSPADQELINLAKIRYSLVVHTHTHTHTHAHTQVQGTWYP